MKREVKMKWVSDIPVWADGKLLPWARAWYSMKHRCYSKKYQAKKPTYIGCRLCKEWHTGSVFKQWYDLHYVPGYHLDKDLLGNGKLYSPETCCYVPGWLNTLLNDRRNARGDLPQGVSHHGNGYQVLLSVDAKRKAIGTYNTPAAAFEAYAAAKWDYVYSKQPLILDLHRGDEIWEGTVRILTEQVGEHLGASC